MKKGRKKGKSKVTGMKERESARQDQDMNDRKRLMDKKQ